MSAARAPSNRGLVHKSGFINVLKPSGMTSFDVVARVRTLSGVKQIGHAGTLDKLATGVLPVAIGKACRLIRFLTSEKIYYAEVLLGQRTTTDDIEGEITETKSTVGTLVDTTNGASAPPQALLDLLKAFEGDQDQAPPNYSAIHHEGKRLYQLARANQMPTDVKVRRVHINRIDLLALQDNLLSIRVWCGGGTYIRALARDLGEKLGCGACIKALGRERSGPFLLDQAHTLAELEEAAAAGTFADMVDDPAAYLALPKMSIDQDEFLRITQGKRIDGHSAKIEGDGLGDEQTHVALLYQAKVVAICCASADNKLQPEVVLLDAESSF